MNEAHYDSDEATAHYVALHKLSEEERQIGHLNCRDYLIEFHREMGETAPSPPRKLFEVLDAMPTIRSDLAEADLLVQAFERSHLGIPNGLLELPLMWAYPIREMILDTHWPAFPSCHIKDVFGWDMILRIGSHLHLIYPQSLSAQNSHWCDVGAFLLELHRRFEPGPYTPAGRMCEFTI